MSTANQIRHLIDRLARLNAADAWDDGLNPTQVAALAYLARANRFSRSPRHVADYLGSTRGTVSQTLKALTRKGLISTVPTSLDRRSIHYIVTPTGTALLNAQADFDPGLDENDLEAVNTALSKVLRAHLSRNGGRSFGLCRTCKHHKPQETGGYCELLAVQLTAPEPDQICHEHAA